MTPDKLLGELKIIFSAITPENIDAAIAQLEKDIEVESEYLARMTEVHEFLQIIAKRYESKVDSRQDGA